MFLCIKSRNKDIIEDITEKNRLFVGLYVQIVWNEILPLGRSQILIVRWLVKFIWETTPQNYNYDRSSWNKNILLCSIVRLIYSVGGTRQISQDHLGLRQDKFGEAEGLNKPYFTDKNYHHPTLVLYEAILSNLITQSALWSKVIPIF